MKYTKEDLKKKKCFIYVKGNTLLQQAILKQYPNIFPKELGKVITYLNLGDDFGWMGDDGSYYRKLGYEEIFPEQLAFYSPSYEIY